MAQDTPDEALVRRAQKGDRDAFLALYNRYFDKVYNRVKSKVPPADVEDVTQEIFIAVVRSLKGFKHRSRFNTWLYTIVNRQVADFYRKYYRRGGKAVSLEDNEVFMPSTTFSDYGSDERVWIQGALRQLPEHYQEIVLMRFADGLTFAQIAQERGQSLEATKSLYRRAIEALRQQMSES
jgi:RNA polymerase sigma-70 factor (ECF subfamily)